MKEHEERIYDQGIKQAYTNILLQCLRGLGVDDPTEAKRLVWVAERQAAISILRDLCAEFGDNDWSDDLHLANIIERHLANYLWAPD